MIEDKTGLKSFFLAVSTKMNSLVLTNYCGVVDVNIAGSAVACEIARLERSSWLGFLDPKIRWNPQEMADVK